MKTKYFLLAVLCCAVFGACQNNDPDKGDKEVVEQLGDFVDGIGKITATETLDDGTVVMKDDKGNTITKDKDGNTVIVSQQGDSTYIDNSIKENGSDPKDKWYHTTWNNNNSPAIIDPNEPLPGIPDIINYLQKLGFQIEQTTYSKDTTVIEQGNHSDYTIHFLNTTGSLLQVDTLRQYTYTRSINYLKITLFPGEIGSGEQRYELVISNNHAELFEKYYSYDETSQQYILEYENLIGEIGVDEDNSITLYRGTDIKNRRIDVISTKNKTTWYNYRRINDSQLAVSNNSTSIILKEVVDSETPKMEAHDLQGNYLATFWLVSFK